MQFVEISPHENKLVRLIRKSARSQQPILAMNSLHKQQLIDKANELGLSNIFPNPICFYELKTPNYDKPKYVWIDDVGRTLETVLQRDFGVVPTLGTIVSNDIINWGN